jgi:uncharacterized membrane protein YfcA
VNRAAGAVLLGASAGFLGGLFGVGGGIVMVPGMVLLFAVAQSRAHATSVAAIVASSTAAMIPMALDGRVNWPAAGSILAGSALGAFLGARLVSRISDLWLARAFLLLEIAAAVRMLLPGGSGAEGGTAGSVELGVSAIGLVAIGLAAGILAALLGIGGGIVFVPALVTLYAFPQHVAQATSLAAMVPTMVVAAATHARAKRVDWPLAVTLGAGGLLGGALGALTALEISAPILRRLFAALLVVVTVRMVVETRRRSRDAAAGRPAG